MQFKEGDRVRIAPGTCYFGKQGIGKIGIITEVAYHKWANIIYVNWGAPENINTYSAEDLELAAPATKEEMLKEIKQNLYAI